MNCVSTFPVFSHVKSHFYILLYVASSIFLILFLTDWGIFESIFIAPHNLKAIMLGKAPVDTILAVLSGRVEEVELKFDWMVCGSIGV